MGMSILINGRTEFLEAMKAVLSCHRPDPIATDYLQAVYQITEVKNRFDVIFTDFEPSNRGAFQILEAAKQENVAVIAVVKTAADEKEAKKAGADGTLYEPVDKYKYDDLISRVEDILREKSSRSLRGQGSGFKDTLRLEPAALEEVTMKNKDLQDEIEEKRSDLNKHKRELRRLIALLIDTESTWGKFQISRQLEKVSQEARELSESLSHTKR